MKFCIAVISDIHCHADLPGKPQESYLIAGSRRLPASRHPTEALVELIGTQSLSADLLLCPGDLANKVCEAGMTQAFNDLKELKAKLNADDLLCCLGNHDVVSRTAGEKRDPFKLARELSRDFPVSEADSKERFENSGYCIHHHGKLATVLLVNSVIDHIDETSAKRGTFDHSRLDRLDKYLTQHQERLNPIRVAAMHHHPVIHSFANYDSSDVLHNGDQIMECFSKHGFEMVIHGHRHEARLSQHRTGTHGVSIFAAGSYSVFLNKLASITRNMFHIIELDKFDGGLRGIIKTWEYNYGIGWNPTSVKSGNFAPVQSFNTCASTVTASVILKKLEELESDCLKRDEFYEAVPDAEYLVPQAVRQLSQELEKDHGVKIAFDEHGQVDSVGKIVQA